MNVLGSNLGLLCFFFHLACLVLVYIRLLLSVCLSFSSVLLVLLGCLYICLLFCLRCFFKEFSLALVINVDTVASSSKILLYALVLINAVISTRKTVACSSRCMYFLFFSFIILNILIPKISSFEYICIHILV